MISKQDFSDVEHQMWLNQPATQRALECLREAHLKILLRSSTKAVNSTVDQLAIRLDLAKAFTIEQTIKSLRENKFDNL